MADIADRAQEVIEKNLEKALKTRSTLHLPSHGECMWCGDSTDGHRFCGDECRDDWKADIAERNS